MKKEQVEAFWLTIKAFKEIGLLQHVMIIGSWAEYLYPPLFETDFMRNNHKNMTYAYFIVKEVSDDKKPLRNHKYQGFLRKPMPM